MEEKTETRTQSAGQMGIKILIPGFSVAVMKDGRLFDLGDRSY